ncbi:MAG: ATP-dependent metallopeptidase FtsH/Yme1/Tma family protein, partial [bacterium]|nr:ATP-dependent metallopeptidase FtsH/Yme1/Tma family protein [bacterium]
MAEEKSKVKGQKSKVDSSGLTKGKNNDAKQKSGSGRFSPGLKIGFGKMDGKGRPIISRELHLNPRKMIVWLLIGLLLLPAIFGVLGNLVFQHVSIPLSVVVEEIRQGKIQKIDVTGQELILHYKDSSEVKTSRKESIESLTEVLERAGVDPKLVEINVQGGRVS